ncbi:APC family permease [Methylobacterium nodulans]|uniref:Putative aminoacid/polyamine transporter, permease protein n=1 Tax=Methylobacterium nodulans (strain LMG 21967 / CNCM I-2342 / ORS 2060) TaxID=460265 RepID=B8IV02_METNO|nr:APC family permease [Methylobacterium nodulans]ACL59060.1 putative aminoacid/polyamine transporter, permease protein [Methylobacterium nodulans ORS 2060]
MSIVGLILGRRLANREYGERKIGAFEGLPAMGLDGLGSSAYGPEAALTVLRPLGAASLASIGWVTAPIVALLVVLFVSYWQTIRAYPTNGGAYVVAKENLGTNASLLAAAALMIDYVLNVAVGISAGVAALVSAVPALHPYILPLCLGILLLVTIVNLRGTLDAGRLFALPTYTFVASFAAILGIGIYNTVTSGGSPHPVVPPPHLPEAAEAVSVWLLLRAFAGGCTAMTGVEAVSNGMSAFREPPVKHGHRTLTAIVVILGSLLAGIAYLATAYRVGAMDQTQGGYRSVLSQLASAVIGEGVFYYVAMGSLLCVLALSANTSFVDFPRLCRAVAQDGFLPKPFAVVGRRLVFSVGILYLAATAGILLTVFGGITDHLIPLFAIGAFMTFTMSQTGMVAHWLRAIRHATSARERWAHKVHLAINAVGATTTGVALIVILSAKFLEGAWITVVVMPLVIVLLKAVRSYYDEVAARVREPGPLDLRETEPPVVLVALEDWNKVGDRALAFAMSLSPDVVGVHLIQLEGPDEEERHRILRAQWKKDVEEPARRAGLAPPRLVILRAGRRTIYEPILELARELQARFGGRRIAVLIPELVQQRWYQTIMHTHRARRLRSRLLKHGGPRLTVVNVPWYLDEMEAPARPRVAA